MEIVFLSSFTTCFLDNNPNCYVIQLGNEAKPYDVSSNFFSHLFFFPLRFCFMII